MREEKPPRRTQHFNVWTALLARGTSRGVDLARDMDIPIDNMHKALQALVRKGCVRGDGNSNKRTFTATLRPPRDETGKSPGSAMGRAIGSAMEHDMEPMRKGFADKMRLRGVMRDQRSRATSSLAGKTALEMFWNPTIALPIEDVMAQNGYKPAHTRALSVGTAEETQTAHKEAA